MLPSFSRPRVSDDNPFPEALFRTLKYRPCYPDKPFVLIEDARGWVASFFSWYNDDHYAPAVVMRSPRSNSSDDGPVWTMKCA